MQPGASDANGQCCTGGHVCRGSELTIRERDDMHACTMCMHNMAVHMLNNQLLVCPGPRVGQLLHPC
jgi:hypothetical protein